MAECARQLRASGHDGPVTHVLPVAPGALVEGLLSYLRAHPALDHRVVGIMTGPALARARLHLRFMRARRVRLVPPARLRREEIAALTRALTRAELELGSTVVLWITSPRPS
jgi:hypothetical protein